MKKKKIIHIIVGLNNGGAEMMLYKLLKYSDRNLYKHTVISLMDEGVMGEEIKKLDITIETLNIKKGNFSLRGFIKLLKLCKNQDIIQTWMYHSDFLGFIISKILRKKIIWGIHHSNLEKDKNKKRTLLIAKINAFLSRWCDEIVSCSKVAKEEHEKYGYVKDKIKVIPNGFELEKFYFIENAKNILQKEFPIIENKLLFSLVARYEILKDHNNCLKAMKIFKEIFSNEFILLLCGTNINYKNRTLISQIKENELEKNVLLLDRRKDIPVIMSATDIYISSSSGEGFPNVLGEAMACETPCIVTDVGDSSYIVGKTGSVIERGSPEKLSKAIIEFINTNAYKKNRKSCRKRIEENFDIVKIIKLYEKLY